MNLSIVVNHTARGAIASRPNPLAANAIHQTLGEFPISGMPRFLPNPDLHPIGRHAANDECLVEQAA